MLSLEISVCSTLKFHPVFSGVIMSMRLFFSIMLQKYTSHIILCKKMSSTVDHISMVTQDSHKGFQFKVKCLNCIKQAQKIC